MGDRANIVVKSGGEQVCLYTHDGGYNLADILRNAMVRGKPRWDDFQYLTRIIFCEMVKGNEMELTGYGITQNIYDGGDQVIFVDVDSQTIIVGGRFPPVGFSDFTDGN